jgi:hypothetical protein
MKYILLLACIAGGMLCSFCTPKEQLQQQEEEQRLPQRTVLIYMAADNNLYRSARADLEEMLQASIPLDGRLLVYLDAPMWSADTCPQLLSIREGKRFSVKQYGRQNSASGNVLQTVIADAMAAFPAESYGLILWSHGTGWLPSGAYDKLPKSSAQRSWALPQSFGKDNGSEMGVMELAEALPDNLEFIIFDACLMSGIEVLYQLRGKAATIVASPTETLVAGLPYAQVLPCLFASPVAYVQAAQAYMNYYNGKAGDDQTASITVVNTVELEAFVQLLSSMLQSPNIKIAPPDKGKIQRYDRLKESLFYDLEDYLINVIQDEVLLLSLRQQLARMVVYNACTPYFLSQLPLTRVCGVSIYLSSGSVALDQYYGQLDWYVDCGADLPL